MTVSIRQATVADADLVAPLFDAYRQFYRQPADLPRARRFLAERLSQRQSTVLVAEAAEGEILGFVQLYPCFSSIRAAPVFILSDLFVAPLGEGRWRRSTADGGRGPVCACDRSGRAGTRHGQDQRAGPATLRVARLAARRGVLSIRPRSVVR